MTRRVAVVSGGGAGIGAAACAALAAEGASVAVLDLDLDAATTTAEQLEATGATAVPFGVDVTDDGAVRAALHRVQDELGTPTAAFLAAGVMQVVPFLERGVADWRRTLDINLTGAFTVLQASARLMVEARLPGAIVAVASVAARGARADAADYAASKAGLVSLVRSSALALAPKGIRVNALCPGVVDTEMTRRNAERRAAQSGRRAEDELGALVQRVPLGRAASPEEVAGVGVALLSDTFGYVTGQAINVCGGLEFD